MHESFTAPDIARRLAPAGDAVTIQSLVRQIQHWTLCGLFDQAGAGPFDKFVGRGRARRYPPQAEACARVFARLMDRGFLVADIAEFIAVLRYEHNAVEDMLDRMTITQGASRRETRFMQPPS